MAFAAKDCVPVVNASPRRTVLPPPSVRSDESRAPAEPTAALNVVTPAEFVARSRFHNAVTLEVVTPDRADVVSAIRQISGVASVEDVQASDAGQGRRVRCVVLAGKGKAVAHEVSHLVKAKGWEVESMRVEGGRLDDVFRDLTRISA